MNAIALADETRIVAQVDDRILHSSDGGISWNEMVTEGVDCLSLDGLSLVLAMNDGSIRRAGY